MPTTEAIQRLEQDFWQALIDKDTAGAAAMIAEDCLITGPSGAMRIDPEKYTAMMRDGKWTLEKFEFSDLDVIFPADDTAVIAYKVRQKGTMKDGPMDMTCADSSTWVRDGDGWKCALHTETILEQA
ncbi:MAG TPA: nuclear transport factor 2 family protein [Sphingomonadaceae bacterium]